MKRLLATILLATIVAVDGGDATLVRNPTFPSSAGVYGINGSFPFTGTTTFNQVSREQPALTSAANTTVSLDAEALTFTTIWNVSISEAGRIGLNIRMAGGSTSRRFEGTLSGGTMTGTHTITDGSSSETGNFTAARQ